MLPHKNVRGETVKIQLPIFESAIGGIKAGDAFWGPDNCLYMKLDTNKSGCNAVNLCDGSLIYFRNPQRPCSRAHVKIVEDDGESE